MIVLKCIKSHSPKFTTGKEYAVLAMRADKTAVWVQPDDGHCRTWIGLTSTVKMYGLFELVEVATPVRLECTYSRYPGSVTVGQVYEVLECSKSEGERPMYKIRSNSGYSHWVYLEGEAFKFNVVAADTPEVETTKPEKRKRTPGDHIRGLALRLNGCNPRNARYAAIKAINELADAVDGKPYYVAPQPGGKVKLAIVDLDGVMNAISKVREHLVPTYTDKSSYWAEWHKAHGSERVNLAMVAHVKALQDQGWQILFMSSRFHSCLETTQKQLNDAGLYDWNICLRGPGDDSSHEDFKTGQVSALLYALTLGRQASDVEVTMFDDTGTVLAAVGSSQLVQLLIRDGGVFNVMHMATFRG